MTVEPDAQPTAPAPGTESRPWLHGMGRRSKLRDTCPQRTGGDGFTTISRTRPATDENITPLLEVRPVRFRSPWRGGRAATRIKDSPDCRVIWLKLGGIGDGGLSHHPRSVVRVCAPPANDPMVLSLAPEPVPGALLVPFRRGIKIACAGREMLPQHVVIQRHAETGTVGDLDPSAMDNR